MARSEKRRWMWYPKVTAILSTRKLVTCWHPWHLNGTTQGQTWSISIVGCFHAPISRIWAVDIGRVTLGWEAKRLVNWNHWSYEGKRYNLATANVMGMAKRETNWKTWKNLNNGQQSSLSWGAITLFHMVLLSLSLCWVLLSLSRCRSSPLSLFVSQSLFLTSPFSVSISPYSLSRNHSCFTHCLAIIHGFCNCLVASLYLSLLTLRTVRGCQGQLHHVRHKSHQHGTTETTHVMAYTPARNYCEMNSENIISCNWNEVLQEINSKQCFHVILWITNEYMICTFRESNSRNKNIFL